MIFLKKNTILIFTILLLVSSILNISIGSFSISFNEIIETMLNPNENKINYKILMEIRIPRIILGILVGVSFGISGVMMQTLFKNSLADPSVIGISAGASAGVVSFMMFSSLLPSIFSTGILSLLSMPISAFLGAIITIYAIYKMSTLYNKVSVTVMLLSGIAINALLSALVGLFTYISTEEELRSYTFWSMGSLSDGDLNIIFIILPIVVLTYLFAINKRVELNLMLLGEDEAKNSGVNTEKLKKLIIIFVSLSIGVSVAFCGIIIFVGLVVPHISRLLIGSNHKKLLPLSAILGALILIWADSIARVIISPAELPIGIITSILGAPFFIWLLIKNKYSSLN